MTLLLIELFWTFCSDVCSVLVALTKIYTEWVTERVGVPWNLREFLNAWKVVTLKVITHEVSFSNDDDDDADAVAADVAACERVGVVSEGAWHQLELSVSNVAKTDSQADIQHSATQLLSSIRNCVNITTSTETTWYVLLVLHLCIHWCIYRLAGLVLNDEYWKIINWKNG